MSVTLQKGSFVGSGSSLQTPKLLFVKWEALFLNRFSSKMLPPKLIPWLTSIVASIGAFPSSVFLELWFSGITIGHALTPFRKSRRIRIICLIRRIVPSTGLSHQILVGKRKIYNVEAPENLRVVELRAPDIESELIVVVVDRREIQNRNGGSSGGVEAAENLGVVLEARRERWHTQLRRTSENVVVQRLARFGCEAISMATFEDYKCSRSAYSSKSPNTLSSYGEGLKMKHEEEQVQTQTCKTSVHIVEDTVLEETADLSKAMWREFPDLIVMTKLRIISTHCYYLVISFAL
nr:hypothetical protein Iba_chr02aCG6850 [Ipomoea batatas]